MMTLDLQYCIASLVSFMLYSHCSVPANAVHMRLPMLYIDIHIITASHHSVFDVCLHMISESVLLREFI